MRDIIFLVLNLVGFLVNSHFLPKEDPADVLAGKLIKGAGIDSEDSPSGHGSSWRASAPSEVTSPQDAFAHQHLAVHDLVEMKPMVDVTGLATPKEWDATPQADVPQTDPSKMEPVQSTLVKDGNLVDPGQLLHEIISKHHHPEYQPFGPEEPQQARSGEVEQELESMAPKEVVKISRHDTLVFHASDTATPRHGLADLGKTVEKYGPVKQEPPIDPAFALHHGHYHQPKAASAVPAPEDEHKRKEQAVAPNHSLSGGPSKKEHPDSSATQSVHRSKRADPIYPISPEDKHQPGTQDGNSTITAGSTPESLSRKDNNSAAIPVQQVVRKIRAKAQQKLPKEQPSVPSKAASEEELFKANAIDGQLEAEDVEKVLHKMKVQQEWNWHPFDLNGDGKLSHREFLNAARVAMRFKVHKGK